MKKTIYTPFKRKKPPKYHNKPTYACGYRFDSIKECDYFKSLLLRTDHGPYCQIRPNNDIDFFLRQVPIHLPGNVTMRVDFVEFRKDGYVYFIDVKGKETKQFIDKKKLVEAVYPPVEIITV